MKILLLFVLMCGTMQATKGNSEKLSKEEKKVAALIEEIIDDLNYRKARKECTVDERCFLAELAFHEPGDELTESARDFLLNSLQFYKKRKK